MLNCNQCGQALFSKVNFCPRCGSRLSNKPGDLAVQAFGKGLSETENTKASASIQRRLIEISRIMNSTLDLDTLLERINVCACELTNAKTGSTMLYDPEKDALYFKVALGEKRDILSRITICSEPPSIAWWVYSNGLPAIVNDTSSDPRFSGAVDEATSYSTKSILCVPITLTQSKGMESHVTTKVIGVIEVINKLSDPPQFTLEDQKILSILAYQAAIAVRNAKEAGDRRNFFANAIEIFITAIESTGFTPPGHCMRVTRSSIGIARKLGLKHDDLHNLYYAAALHDIGVLDIRCRRAHVSQNGCPRSHTIIGAEMVRPVNLLTKTEPIIQHHHEAWDGSGYPGGIKGNSIPLGARIVAVAEAYEEMGLRKEFIAANAGKLFDPEVVDAFLKIEL